MTVPGASELDRGYICWRNVVLRNMQVASRGYAWSLCTSWRLNSTLHIIVKTCRPLPKTPACR